MNGNECTIKDCPTCREYGLGPEIPEKLPCGCDNTVSILVTVEVYVPVKHYADQVKYKDELTAAAVDELVDDKWETLVLKHPQPPQATLNPPHTWHGERVTDLTRLAP